VESGSGKAPLANLFLLFERPTAGSLLFDGKQVEKFDKADLLQYRRAVQTVFEAPYSALNPRMHVADIVAEPVLPEMGLGRTAVRERVAEVLALVGLSQQSTA